MLAAIDVGTNTVRTLIGEVQNGRVVPERYHRRITRLGGGATGEGALSEAAMSRTLEALREFSGDIRKRGVRAVRAVGTEALRKAPNAAQFVAGVDEQTGIPLKVIDGDEEARLSSSGVLSILDPRPERCLIFDVGGGSTEFILVERGRVLFHRSYPLGVVRLAESVATEDELPGRIDPVLDGVLRELKASTGSLDNPDGLVLAGTAGTVTTLAAIDMEMANYDWRRVNNHHLDYQALVQISRRLRPLSPREREQVPGMEEGRGDLILPGLAIVLGLMDRLDCASLTVSDFGLLEGLLIDLDT